MRTTPRHRSPGPSSRRHLPESASLRRTDAGETGVRRQAWMDPMQRDPILAPLDPQPLDNRRVIVDVEAVLASSVANSVASSFSSGASTSSMVVRCVKIAVRCVPIYATLTNSAMLAYWDRSILRPTSSPNVSMRRAKRSTDARSSLSMVTPPVGDGQDRPRPHRSPNRWIAVNVSPRSHRAPLENCVTSDNTASRSATRAGSGQPVTTSSHNARTANCRSVDTCRLCHPREIQTAIAKRKDRWQH
jgi:hypothetical protein